MSSSYTSTYTVVDVRKVLDQMRSDLRMAAQSSGAMTVADADAIMADIVKYAENDYVSAVLFRLVSAAGTTIKAVEYEITKSAGSLTASRSGNMMWPETSGGYIATLVTTSNAFDNLSSAAQDAFRKTLGRTWNGNAQTPSLAHLTPSADRNYVSNEYGAKKKNYS